MKKATPALLLAGLAVSACLQAQAAEPQATQTQAAIGADNAVMVGIDAKTHQLRPLTAAEAKALAAKAAAMPRQARSSSIKAPRTPEEARATIDAAIPLATGPDLQRGLYNRAVAREALGDVKGAYADLKRAVELDPGFEAAKLELTRYQVISK